MTMDASSTGPGARSPLVALLDHFRPARPVTARVAFQLRFLVGSSLLAVLVGLPAIVMTVLQRDAVAGGIIFGFLACVLAQLGAARLGAPVRVLAPALLTTVALFLVAISVTTRELQSDQLAWLVLLPVASLVLQGPHADDATPTAAVWPTVLSTVGAITAAVVVIGAHATGATLDRPLSNSPWLLALNTTLFLVSVSGLLQLYALSAREAQAELQQLRQLLSVCAWCRKIKDEGAWIPLELYLTRKHRSDLSHGICPACMNEHYPEE